MHKSKGITLVLGLILFLLIGSCRFVNDAESPNIPTSQENPTTTPQYSTALGNSQTEATTKAATPQPVATATIIPTESVVPTATKNPVILPDWVKNANSELYLCIAPDENGERHLAIVNPISQEIFLFSIREKEIKAYFWVTEPERGIGWVNPIFDEYSILGFSSGTIVSYPISREAKLFAVESFPEGEPTSASDRAYPVKKIVLINGEAYFIPQNIGDFGYDYSKNISPNEQFYIFDVKLKEDRFGNFIQVNGYDFHKQREISYDIQEIDVDRPFVNWLPNSNTLVEIGDYIIDISDGSIVQELPKIGLGQERAWNSKGDEFYFNPISIWDFYSLDNATGTEIFIYSMDKKTTEKLAVIDEYFQHHELFDLHQVFINNLTYISSIDVLGFSYFGTGTTGEYVLSTAGGYCLYSFVTNEIDCVTDAVEEMLIVVDESASYMAREEVEFAQWSNSNKFIVFYVQRADDHPRLMMYDLETGSYFFINNYYFYSPLGIWSP
ncbi:MAG: hypothetical protein HPY85_12835 [Anaerolineae bacterium]|nr:hypothetical protein [Anaerolineae bacterium]